MTASSTVIVSDDEKGSNLAKDKSSLLKHVLVLIAILIGLQVVFFICNICAAALPKDTIEQHIDSSDNSVLTQYFYYGDATFGSNVSYDNNRFIEAFAKQDEFDGDVIKESVVNKVEYTLPDSVHTIEYFRYWHGWQLPVFLCLMIGNLDFLAVILGLYALATVCFFIWNLRYYSGWIPALGFALICFFSTNILGNFVGDLLLCLSITTLTLFCGLSLYFGRKHEGDIYRQDIICLIDASVFCYLDFLTVPSYAIALYVFCAMIASGALNGGFKQAFKLFVRFTIIFLIGFCATWISKWLVASVYLGFGAVLSNIFGEIGIWTADAPSQEGELPLADRFPRLFAIKQSFVYVSKAPLEDRQFQFNIAGIAAVVITMLILLAVIIEGIRSRRLKSISVRNSLALLLPLLFIPIATMVMYHHVLWHIGIFGYKPWAFVLADIAFVGLYVLCSSGRQRLQGCLNGDKIPVKQSLRSNPRGQHAK